MNKIKQLINNKDVRVLLENFISLSSLKVLTYVLPLISLPYLSRTIGVEKFGMIAFAASIMVFFQTFVDYGFNYTGIRDISRNKNDKKIVNEIFSTILFIRILFTLFSAVVLLILVNAISSLSEYRLLFFYSFLIIPGGVLFPEWFFQAFEKMKYVTLFNIISKLIFTLLIFIVIRKESDYIYVPLLTSLGAVTAGIGSVVFIICKFKVKIIIPSFKLILSYIKNSFDMFITLMFPNLYTNLSTILIENYWGKSATGIFSAGYKVIGLTSSISDVISRVFYPFLARRIDKHGVYVKFTLFLNLFFSIILYVMADFSIEILFGESFRDAVVIVKIMSLTPLFLFLMGTYGTNYLVLINREDVLRKIVVSVSLLGCLIAYTLIYLYSYKGAAISISLVWFIRGILTYIFAQKNMKDGSK